MSNPSCRGCGSNLTESCGPLPNVRSFAGRTHAAPIVGGDLYKCKQCRFVFRDPLLKKGEYANLYRHGSANVWNSEGQRRDFEIVRECLDSLALGPTVLDVGCYTGNLLATLPGHYRLHGIEPNIAAATIAMQRGITIVADNVDALHTNGQRFDVIIACDVIEHLASPIPFLTQLRDQLTVNGRILLTTGDSDAWLWRFARSNFWYCFFPEHISFIGRKWLTKNAHLAGLRIDRIHAFNYRFHHFSPSQAKLMTAALLYATSPAIYRFLYGKTTKKNGVEFSPPGCGASKDHLLCVMSAT